MKIQVKGHGAAQAGPEITAICPACGRHVTFDRVAVQDLALEYYVLGQRKCPNTACWSHVFFVFDSRTGRLLSTFPAQRIPFDKKGIPENVVGAAEEAITCYAEGCYKAAAIMIRRTLEEICRDRGAAGATLKDRVRALEPRIVIPKELFEGMDELRLLGNDAAHVESRDYDAIGKDEVDVAIEFTKEILKAVYQYAQLLDKLRGLKKGQTPGAVT